MRTIKNAATLDQSHHSGRLTVPAALVTATIMLTGCASWLGGGGDPEAESGGDVDGAALLEESRPLESGEILAIVANNTLNHGPFMEYYAADGTVSGRIDGGDLYSGLWAIDSEGRVCTQLPDFDAEGCAAVFATPSNELLFVTPDERVTILTVESGDQVTNETESGDSETGNEESGTSTGAS